MSATITIPLDPAVVEQAEREARRRQTTVAEVVARQLEIMALNWQDSEAGRTPITDGLRGSISGPQDFNERSAVAEEVSRRHGI